MEKCVCLDRLSLMMAEAVDLGQLDIPVLATEMPRIVAILHETLQLLDAGYLSMQPRAR